MAERSFPGSSSHIVADSTNCSNTRSSPLAAVGKLPPVVEAAAGELRLVVEVAARELRLVVETSKPRVSSLSCFSFCFQINPFLWLGIFDC